MVAPPPLIFLAFLGVGMLLEWPWPTHLLSWPVAVGVGVACLSVGLVGLQAAIRTVWRGQTPVDPRKPTTAIVTAGLYGLSRNPIYVSEALIYLGVSLALNAEWAIALVPVLLWTVQVGVIEPEERYLEKVFGHVYLDYKRRVRRWL